VDFVMVHSELEVGVVSEPSMHSDQRAGGLCSCRMAPSACIMSSTHHLRIANTIIVCVRRFLSAAEARFSIRYHGAHASMVGSSARQLECLDRCGQPRCAAWPYVHTIWGSSAPFCVSMHGAQSLDASWSTYRAIAACAGVV